MNTSPNKSPQFPADDDPKQGSQGTSNQGARNKGSLRHGDKSQWPDSNNDKSGDGFGGPVRRLR